jgi:chromosome segregation ATPase
VTLENEQIRLQSIIDDLEYQLGKLVRVAATGQTVEEEMLRLRLIAESREAEVQSVLGEKFEISVQNLKDKNKMMELEFEKAVLESKVERLLLASAATHIPRERRASPRQSESRVVCAAKQTGEIEQLRAEFSKIKLENTNLRTRERNSREELDSLRKEVAELRSQRDQDKAAIKEAEKVLALVQATEKKYVKVAKENARLKKDLASLDDDNFWNDLDVLQNQHKESLQLLQNIRNDHTYINQRPDVAREIDLIISS